MKTHPSAPATFSHTPRSRFTLQTVGTILPLIIGLVAAACEGSMGPEGPHEEQGIEEARGVMTVGDAKVAALERGGETTLMLYVDEDGRSADLVLTDRRDGQAQASGWFPLPPELTALCGTLLECKPCGWAPECQYVVGGDLVAVEPKSEPASVPFPWFPVHEDLVWAICVGLGDVFECKSTEEHATADFREFVARARDSNAHAILVKVCGPTADNGFPGCFIATLR